MAPRDEPIQPAEEATSNRTTTTRVVVVGAGPGGLLAAINLLRRNLSGGGGGTKYEVTLVDPGVDYGALDEDGLSKRRSWMIGLSSHGLDAVKEIPGLYENYVEALGVKVVQTTFAIGSRLQFHNKKTDQDVTGFCVDRNYVCGALARYLNDHFGSDDNDNKFTRRYDTRVLYVDGDNHTVWLRPNDNPQEQTPLEYDILLGCDGIRSVVRNAFVTNHREFEFDLMGAFGTYKSLHLTLPPQVGEGHFMFLASCFPQNVGGFVLPERGQKLNVAFGWNLNDTPDPELCSTDPTVVEEYARKHFKVFDMDCKEFAEQWCAQNFQTTQMVHCNFYHSLKLKALLLGDAAHATVPNIGQGMNTALADAGVLNRLLDEHKDNWEEVLPAFSKERVKEGNALTELSYNTFCSDPSIMLSIVLRQNIHRVLNKFLPAWLLELEPMQQVPRGMKLSLAYDKMVQYGYMARARQKNQDLKRSHFEKQVGMVQERPSSSSSKWSVMTAFAAVAAVGCGVALSSSSSSSASSK